MNIKTAVATDDARWVRLGSKHIPGMQTAKAKKWKYFRTVDDCLGILGVQLFHATRAMARMTIPHQYKTSHFLKEELFDKSCYIYKQYQNIQTLTIGKVITNMFRLHFVGKNSNPDSESKKGSFRFFGKIQKRIMNPMNLLATRIQWINLNPDSQDLSLLRFFGK